MGSPDQDCSSYCNRDDAPGHGRPKYWVSKHMAMTDAGSRLKRLAPLGAHPSGACRCDRDFGGSPRKWYADLLARQIKAVHLAGALRNVKAIACPPFYPRGP